MPQPSCAPSPQSVSAVPPNMGLPAPSKLPPTEQTPDMPGNPRYAWQPQIRLAYGKPRHLCCRSQ